MASAATLHLYCLVRWTGRCIGREASRPAGAHVGDSGDGAAAMWPAWGERSASTSGDVGTGRRRCWRHLRSSPGDADAEGDLSETQTNGDGISNGICGGIVRLTLFYR
jgi:hypothetical protein